MKKSTKGAWIIHHAHKLQGITGGFSTFPAIDFAGKCGKLLSAITENRTQSCDLDKVKAYAKAAGINVRTELDSILGKLGEMGLLDRGNNTVEILGVTTASVLIHTQKIFSEEDRNEREDAAILIAEQTSHAPMLESGVLQLVSDKFKLSERSTREAVHAITNIELVDYEACHTGEHIYFNENLFKRNDVNKIQSVLSVFSPEEAERFHELDSKLLKHGCLRLEVAEAVVGAKQFEKLHSIGLYDVNSIGNERGMHKYVTKPSAFSKFKDSIADDAFDLAKAFVSSLTYGMENSPFNRGRIQAIDPLMRRLIDGAVVGPATAIGKDYKILELKGVLEIKSSKNFGRFNMRLKKREVGELALKVIQEGDASSSSLESMPQFAADNYLGPEDCRMYTRKKSNPALTSEVSEILSHLRKGGN